MKKRFRWFLAPLVLAVALAAGCASDEDEAGEGSGPVNLGAAMDLTGYLASFDRGVNEGVELAVEQINEEGGVLDSDLVVTAEDMKADPQQGVRVTQKLIDQNGAVGMINGFSSASTEAVDPIAEQQQVPVITASVIPEGTKWAFSTLPKPEFETGVRMEWLAEQGVKSVGVLMDATPYNEAQLAALEAQAKELGIEVTRVVQHESDAVDLRPQITQLLHSDPEAIMKLSAGPTHVLAARALANAGADIPLLLSIEAIDTVRQATDAYPETYFAAAPPQVYEALDPEERSAELERLIEIAPKDQDLTYVGRGYDATLLFAEAIEEAGSTDGEAIRTALEELPEFEGTSGVYDFTADNHYGVVKNPLFLGQVQADGSSEIVYRPEE